MLQLLHCEKLLDMRIVARWFFVGFDRFLWWFGFGLVWCFEFCKGKGKGLRHFPKLRNF